MLSPGFRALCSISFSRPTPRNCLIAQSVIKSCMDSLKVSCPRQRFTSHVTDNWDIFDFEGTNVSPGYELGLEHFCDVLHQF